MSLNFISRRFQPFENLSISNTRGHGTIIDCNYINRFMLIVFNENKLYTIKTKKISN